MENIKELKRESAGGMYSIPQILKSYAINTRHENCLNGSNHTKEIVEEDIEKYLDIWFDLFKGVPVAPIQLVFRVKEEDKFEVLYGEDTYTAICNLDLFFDRLCSDIEYQKRFYISNDVVSFEEFSLWISTISNMKDIKKFIPYVKVVKGTPFECSTDILEKKFGIIQGMIYNEYKDLILYAEVRYLEQ